jgi:nucleoside-diphosphate-sugar epimerase
MKILITGGTGFIGSHLANYLCKNNDVTICDNNFRGKNDNFVEDLNYIECDLTKEKDYDKLDNYDYVYHFAAINGTSNFYEIPYEVLEVNTLININLIKWCKKTKVKKVLYTSSSEVYASTKEKEIPTKEDVVVSIDDVYNPRWSYAGSKIFGELLFINSGINFYIVRPHNVYGPRMGYNHVIPEVIKRVLLKETPFKIYGADQTRSFCYIDDAVTMLDLIMNSSLSDGRIINLGVADEIVIKDLIYKIFSIFEYDPQINILKSKEGSVNRRCPNIDLLTDITNITKFTSIDEGLKKTCEWYKNDALL